MSELKLCSYCKSVPQANTWTLHGITETRYFCPNPDCPHSVRTVRLEQWNTRPIEDDLRKRIAELEAGNDQLTARWRQERQDDKWIPVSKRLPEDGKPVWVCTIWNEQHSGFLIDGVWGGLFRDFREGEVTYWMSLPEPPESPNDTQTQTIVYGKESEE